MTEKTITRAQLSEAVYQEVGLSRNESADLLEAVLDEISGALARGEAVKISSFGSFSVRSKGQRIGRNPKTGEEVPHHPAPCSGVPALAVAEEKDQRRHCRQGRRYEMTGDDVEEVPGRRTGKSEAAFRTISEVADELDVPQHVLRFWEGKFPQVKPLKRGGGRRYYRPDDVALLRRIRDLLYSEGYTIKGVQKLLKEGGSREGGAPAPVPTARTAEPELSLGFEDSEDGDGDQAPFEVDGHDDEEPQSRRVVVAVPAETGSEGELGGGSAARIGGSAG